MLPGLLGLCFLPWGLAHDISGAHGSHGDTETISSPSVGPSCAILSGKQARKSKVLLAMSHSLTILCGVTVVTRAHWLKARASAYLSLFTFLRIAISVIIAQWFIGIIMETWCT